MCCMAKADPFIPQIKPDSVLDPPKISPNTEAAPKAYVERERGGTLVSKRFRLPRVSARTLKWGGTALVVLLILTSIFVVIPGVALAREGQVLGSSALRLRESIATKDISVLKGELQTVKADLANFQRAFERFSWAHGVPIVGAYWRDGEAMIKAGISGIEAGEIVIETAEPYAGIIGFGGANSKMAGSPEETTNDRVDFLVSTIEGVLPRLDELALKANRARDYLNEIDPNRYPEEFRGVMVRGQLNEIIDLANQGADFVTNGKPLMEAVPYLVGANEPRTYLLLFQNDKELRATGGFITAYSVITVDSGKINSGVSNDIYNLDQNYNPSIEAPDPVIEFIRGPYILNRDIRLRDMNWSPDFRESMETFLPEAQTAGIPDVDGVIAVDTEVAVRLLEAIGPIGVGGFGNFSAELEERCNCPQVIYELENYADTEGPVVWDPVTGEIVFGPSNYFNRKDVVGPLMNSMLTNALGQPSERLPDLFQAGWELVTEKHVLFYMLDEDVQAGIEAFGVGGRIKDYDGDYLHINDSNLGGRKSNLYVTHQVEQEIEIQEGGAVVKTLTLTYNNPQPQDGWLNSVLPNWTRVYIPEGSELLSADGFDNDAEVYSELGKTVFAGGFELRPQGVKKVTLRYRLPFVVSGEYKMFIQKQAGKNAPLYSVTIGRESVEQFLKTDKEFTFRI